eukprot:m.135664 g.135664  ORF g.135664 m.135664 type:complete len:919 (+) comp22613_c0_seq4:246-3002(+)
MEAHGKLLTFNRGKGTIPMPARAAFGRIPRGSKISVVVLIGNGRSGKSTLAGHLIGQPGAFQTGDTDRPVTEGIDYAIVKQPNSKWLVVLDVEGGNNGAFHSAVDVVAMMLGGDLVVVTNGINDYANWLEAVSVKTTSMLQMSIGNRSSLPRLHWVANMAHIRYEGGLERLVELNPWLDADFPRPRRHFYTVKHMLHADFAGNIAALRTGVLAGGVAVCGGVEITSGAGLIAVVDSFLPVLNGAEAVPRARHADAMVRTQIIDPLVDEVKAAIKALRDRGYVQDLATHDPRLAARKKLQNAALPKDHAASARKMLEGWTNPLWAALVAINRQAGLVMVSSRPILQRKFVRTETAVRTSQDNIDGVRLTITTKHFTTLGATESTLRNGQVVTSQFVDTGGVFQEVTSSSENIGPCGPGKIVSDAGRAAERLNDGLITEPLKAAGKGATHIGKEVVGAHLAVAEAGFKIAGDKASAEKLHTANTKVKETIQDVSDGVAVVATARNGLQVGLTAAAATVLGPAAGPLVSAAMKLANNEAVTLKGMAVDAVVAGVGVGASLIIDPGIAQQVVVGASSNATAAVGNGLAENGRVDLSDVGRAAVSGGLGGAAGGAAASGTRGCFDAPLAESVARGAARGTANSAINNASDQALRTGTIDGKQVARAVGQGAASGAGEAAADAAVLTMNGKPLTTPTYKECTDKPAGGPLDLAPSDYALLADHVYGGDGVLPDNCSIKKRIVDPTSGVAFELIKVAAPGAPAIFVMAISGTDSVSFMATETLPTGASVLMGGPRQPTDIVRMSCDTAFAEFRQIAGPGTSFSVTGHSYGGLSTEYLARKHPDAIGVTFNSFCNEETANVVAFRSKRDIVGAHTDRHVYAPQGPLGDESTDSGHGMKRMIDDLKQSEADFWTDNDVAKLPQSNAQ